MKDYWNGRIMFECDCCDEYLHTDTNQWKEAMDVLKREGWKAHKVVDEWVHGCPKHRDSLK